MFKAETSFDDSWISKVEHHYQQCLSKGNLKVKSIADHFSISERQFHRKVKQYTDLTPNRFLQEMRLQKAKNMLLQSKAITVKEVGYAIGFNNSRYFSNLFMKRFGIRPSKISKLI
ncbi:MAG: AraC family transcriptional regulator [Saprospiraceae bacterium]|nr:AraC family transcriptional regulator [Saprospiraceae bacterium]